MDITSKYFCTSSTHESCNHDWDKETKAIMQIIEEISKPNPYIGDTSLGIRPRQEESVDEKDLMIAQLMQQLRLTQDSSESYWQNKLMRNFQNTSLGRETLGQQRFVTDFSNRNVLIELKNQRDIRTAIGQVSEYMDIKRRQGHPMWLSYILLFGDLKKWTPSLWHDRKKLCEKHGIALRWLCL